MIPISVVQILSSITQIVVYCAFSVQVCVLRCTVQREGCEFSTHCFFSVEALMFGVLIASVPKAAALMTG